MNKSIGTNTEHNNELKEIKETLLILTKKIESLDKTCSRMDSHINFVEGTYQSLRTPLDYLKQKTEMLLGQSEGKKLPMVKNENIFK